MLPPDMLGLTDEQVEELHLVDEWADTCVPSGGWTPNPDPVGRRNGRQPQEKMQDILEKAVSDARLMISKKQIDQGMVMQQKIVQDALDLLRGAVTIVYPMQLPPHDPIRMEFSNTEDLTGTQVSGLGYIGINNRSSINVQQKKLSGIGRSIYEKLYLLMKNVMF